MLENSLWSRYNGEKTIRETLAAIYGCNAIELSANEGELYAVLKRHLTKKELRLFCMNEGGVSAGEIAAETGIDAAQFETARHKSYRKIKQGKIRSESVSSCESL